MFLGFEDPIYIISSGLILLLAVIGLIKIFWILRHKSFMENIHFTVLGIDQDVMGKGLKELLLSIKTPFSFEVAIHNLGNKLNYYLVVPKKRAKNLIKLDGVSEVEDYHIFHSGGSHMGAYFKGGHAWPSLDINKIDFSKVNDVGEGVVVQMVFDKAPLKDRFRKDKAMAVNFRVLASAPSDYQANEIVDGIKKSFSEYGSVDVNSPMFTHVVNFREFVPKEQMVWYS